jgi:hypothetical protein
MQSSHTLLAIRGLLLLEPLLLLELELMGPKE